MLILVLQRWLPKIPAVLIMVVLSIAATSVFSLADHGVSLVGVLPKGFPPLTVPHVHLADLGPLFAGALGIALVSLADTISTASAFAARTGAEVRGNGEMIGIGAANLAAGLFQGFPVSTSGSRTAVAERSGAKTQLTGVTGAVLIILMIVLIPGLFRNLPQPALAAVVITASLSLADIPGTVRLWRQRKTEFALSIAAFLGVALLGVLPGIAIAVALSILNVFRRAWRPYDTKLGRAEGLEGYQDVRTHPEAQQLPGLVIYRSDAPLFFANAKTFRDEIRRLANSEPKPRWILIAAEPVTDVDTTASDVLEDLDEALNAQGTSLVFAELKDPVRAKIERYGLTRTIDPRHFFPTLESAVAAFRQETGAEWTPPARPPITSRDQAEATPKPARHPTFPHHHPSASDKGVIILGTNDSMTVGTAVVLVKLSADQSRAARWLQLPARVGETACTSARQPLLAWNGSWNGSPENPSAKSSVIAIRRASPGLVTSCPGVRSDPQPDQFAVEGPAVCGGSVGSDDSQPSGLDGDPPDLVVALPVREQQDVDVMGDGPVAGIGTERPGVGDEVPGHFFVVVAGAALRVTGRDRWPCRVPQRR